MRLVVRLAVAVVVLAACCGMSLGEPAKADPLHLAAQSRVDLTKLKAVRDGLREYANLNFRNYSLSPVVYGPVEINPDHLLGRAEWWGVGRVNLLDRETRENAYSSALYDLLMFAESDPPDLSPVSEALGGASTAHDFYTWLNRPKVRITLQRYVRLRALPSSLSQWLQRAGLASIGVNLASSVKEAIVLAGVHKQDVEERARILAALIRATPDVDPALAAAASRARDNAVRDAGNALAGLCNAIAGAAQNPSTVVDLVAVAEFLEKTKSVRKLFPYRWPRKTPIGAASKLLSSRDVGSGRSANANVCGGNRTSAHTHSKSCRRPL